MTGFMGDPDCGFKTFTQLVEIFARERTRLEREDPSSRDLETLRYERDMIAGKWRAPAILFLRDEEGLIGDGIHRGIAYLRSIENGADQDQLPELLLGPIGSYVWPPGLKQHLIEQQGCG